MFLDCSLENVKAKCCVSIQTYLCVYWNATFWGNTFLISFLEEFYAKSEDKYHSHMCPLAKYDASYDRKDC